MAKAQQESKVPHPFFLKHSNSKENIPEPVSNSFFTPTPVNENLPSSSPTIQPNAKSGKFVGETQKVGLTRGSDAELLEVDPNDGRRKRRKSTPPEENDNAIGKNTVTLLNPQVDVSPNISGASTSNKGNDQETELVKLVTVTISPSKPTKLDVDSHTSTCASSFSTETSNTQLIGVQLANIPSTNLPKKAVGPQKLLVLDPKTGKIGPPPRNHVLKQLNDPNVKARNPKNDKKAKIQIVVIRYGRDVESKGHIGEQIERLMRHVVLPPVESPTEVPKQGTPSKQRGNSATHPFFLGKSRVAVPTASSVTVAEMRKVPEVAKASLPKAYKMFTTPKPSSPMKRMPLKPEYSGPSFGNSRKIMKFPGALEPCWPPLAMMSVSGNIPGLPAPFPMSAATFVKTERKSKQSNVEILSNEDIMRTLAASLRIAEVCQELRQVESDKFPMPHACLRLPRKLLESGVKLQRRVRRQVVSPLPTLGRKELSEDELNPAVEVVHPAIERVYKSIPTTLTAFERFTYDTQSWISKYAPSCAAQVLQTGKEAFILRDWLLALTIVAVDTGVGDNRSRAASVASKRSAGKRKRKSNKLDGFVISSDDEDGDMNEISESDGDASPRGSQGLWKRSVIRARDISRGKEAGKLSNAVVISGPSGCGKTAMVYAVAKELGFEIFEINSSSRRSGKDILEKVGDMTQNHQVRRSKPGHTDAIDDDVAEVSAALAEDLRSGRQETMNSFFKPNSSTSKTSKSMPKKESKHRNVQKPSLQTQKQSLILVEEVDILFEEDKLFWSTIITLIAQSKRPIVMTCNDEALVPLQSLTLHAIIRLNPPPVDIAVDYLLLVAAAEGHAIEREAAMTLFKSRKFDLRASLTELNYWCQIGVGGFKSGLDWFYPSWLMVSDLDEQGNKIRVVSDGTYGTGMGWLSRNVLHWMDCDVSLYEEVMREVWEGWQIDFSTSGVGKAQMPTLESYEAYIDSISAIDVLTNGRLSNGNQVLLDTTLPAMSSKSRDDFILGLEVLEADNVTDFDCTINSIAFYLKALAGNRTRQTEVKFEETRSHYLEKQAIQTIIKDGTENNSLSRHDFSLAFDPIAEPERKHTSSISSLECSVFDQTIAIIAQDVAPYVRSIVTHDAKLQQERAALSNLLSEGGRKGKKMRTTRAALSALEGGKRNTTRPDRYFGSSLNSVFVLKTGLQIWQDALAFDMAEQRQVGEDEEVSTPAGTC